jgi:hypothetical protein
MSFSVAAMLTSDPPLCKVEHFHQIRKKNKKWSFLCFNQLRILYHCAFSISHLACCATYCCILAASTHCNSFFLCWRNTWIFIIIKYIQLNIIRYIILIADELMSDIFIRYPLPFVKLAFHNFESVKDFEQALLNSLGQWC